MGTKDDKEFCLDALSKDKSASAVIKGLQDFSQRFKLLEAKREELAAQFPDKWVAIAGEGQVIAADTLEGLLAALDSKGIHRDGTPIAFLESKPVDLAL